jgi:Astacin (Peptidase family M12A)
MKNVFLTFFLIGLSFSGPLKAAAKDYTIVEGDIALKRSGDKSSFLRTANRWPGGVIPWMVDGRDANNKNLLNAIKGAMDILNKDTNLVFKPKTEQDKNYIVFTTQENGCFSYVGMQGGAQEVNLSKGCHYNLIVAHEILHAIGMEHEQSREDRDDHIKINWDNIKEDQKHNFGIVKRSNFGEYNLTSIMQYGSYSFSKNNQPTMTTIDGEVFEQNIKYFTKGDAEAVNNFYSFKFNFDLTKVDLSFKHEDEETTFVQLKADPQLIKSIDSVVYKINGGENSTDVITWDNSFRYNFKPLKGRNVINVTFNLKDGTKQEAEFTYFSIDRKLSVNCHFSAKRENTDFIVPITYEGDEPSLEARELGNYFAKASAIFNMDTNAMELKMMVGRKPGLIRREQKEEQTFTITETKTQRIESDRAELTCDAINEAL